MRDDEAKKGAVGAALTAQQSGTSIAWLADAPLFIDKEQVASFYDAVVRPEGRSGTTTLSLDRYSGETLKLKGAIEGKASLSELITTLLPFLDISAKVNAGAEGDTARSSTSKHTFELHPIETPQRQLVQLALHYLANLPARIRLVASPEDGEWSDPKFISALPRSLVFIDFPPGTKFVPMAAEVDKGVVVLLYDMLGSEGNRPPAYPERTSFVDEASRSKAREEYWQWFEKHFSAGPACAVVEKAVAGGGRIQWIDYRVPRDGEVPLHLHISGRGQFDTGTFAYNLIKRGHSHGLRFVGTLKSEPDLNVLAVFEK